MGSETRKSAGMRQRPPQSPRALPDPEAGMRGCRGPASDDSAHFPGQRPEVGRRDDVTIPGTFKEVRGLLGMARLLDLYLRAAPLAAARGRTSFSEVLDQKVEILRDLSALRQRIHRAAESVCLILPRVPRKNMKEMSGEDAAALRAS